jgi:hypothetical protein
MILFWLSIILGIAGVVTLLAGAVFFGIALLVLAGACLLWHWRRVAEYLASPAE